PITVPATAANISTQINNMLKTAGALGYIDSTNFGSAAVLDEGNASVFVVTFGGTLAGVPVPLMVASSIVPIANATTAQRLFGGESNTIVQSGASLKMNSAGGF